MCSLCQSRQVKRIVPLANTLDTKYTMLYFYYGSHEKIERDQIRSGYYVLVLEKGVCVRPARIVSGSVFLLCYTLEGT